jgi:hypothetical protein
MSSLAFAVGVYLPLSTSMPIMLGGIVRAIAERTARRKMTAAETESGPGVLFSSGLIAGASVAGMVVALAQLPDSSRDLMAKLNVGRFIPGFAGSDLAAFILFLGVALVLYLVANEYLLKGPPAEAAHAGGPGPAR